MEGWRTILLLREALFGWPLGDILPNNDEVILLISLNGVNI